MKKLSILLLLISSTNVWALEAVVTVLEAPLFKYKSLEAPVVQYKRKGDVIKVHPSLANKDKYDSLAPTPEKLKAIRERLGQSPEYNQDPLFRGEAANTYSLEDEFIPTLDRQGKEVFILASHIYVYLENQKELNQNLLSSDPTDYRLEEPLEKDYPFHTVTGYRGQILLGFTQPYTESYPYLSEARTKGYQNPIDFNFTYLRKHPSDQQDRFFYGGTLQVKIYQNRFSFSSGSAEESGTRIGLGPYLSYDAYKGVKNRINLFGSLNFYLFNQISISQKSGALSDSRTYRTYSVSPRFGVQYHRKSVFEELDFVVGTSVEMDPPSTYKATGQTRVEGLWKDPGSDHFTTRAVFNLAGFIGFQKAY